MLNEFTIVTTGSWQLPKCSQCAVWMSGPEEILSLEPVDHGEMVNVQVNDSSDVIQLTMKHFLGVPP